MHVRSMQYIWFLLARTKNGSAAAIIARCEHNGNPGGREAKLELERIYRDLGCYSPEESSAFVVKLNSIWGEFETLEMER